MAETDIPAVILAGGQGRRIGGDKAQVSLGGVPLWQYVARRVEPQVSVLAVNGEGAFNGLPKVPDEVPGLGPLGGILTAMVWARQAGALRVLTVAVDTPFLPRDLLGRLAVVDAPVAVAQTADGLHGTTALWDVTLADDLRDSLAGGTRKVTDWSARVGQRAVMFPDTAPPSFFNVNTPDDLALAEAWL